ncbi:hypothetical protein J8273_3460 [Carpediemonas membranifera]|uniref:Uncharacterized protein n=1 Tax=Carpediemonas membranifera TaxID=201153 RepID=A0A8J6E1P9_9EUKA|nr:hypothetical protein J8273_3460 [Carpediemonas membranifera]|eukprot:KAG9393326.1 hypothetical protein J8273_3460 [Carpediemonas membranifera]
MALRNTFSAILARFHDYKAQKVLLSAYELSAAATDDIAGDVPSLLLKACNTLGWKPKHNSNAQNWPLEHNSSPNSVDTLLDMLRSLPPLPTASQAIINRAIAILAYGPELSMNVELNEGQHLPDRLHTLLQSTVWATLVQGGADPDLGDDPALQRVKYAYQTADKCLWFLCKKFFFSLHVATHDGESFHFSGGNQTVVAHYLYAGIMFKATTDITHHHAHFVDRFAVNRGFCSVEPVKFTRLVVPRVLHVHRYRGSYILETPHGQFGLGDNYRSRLGLEGGDVANPIRITFPACTKVSSEEARLPAWGKHELVRSVHIRATHTLVLTRVGLIVAGYNHSWFTGAVANPYTFNEVDLPAGFFPDHVICEEYLVLLTMGRQQMLSGRNDSGQLGLGHHDWMRGFVKAPLPVSIAVANEFYFNIVMSGTQLLFSGKVPSIAVKSGVLPFREDTIRSTPTPLRFPERVTQFYCDNTDLVWVGGGKTHCCTFNVAFNYTLPFEAAAMGVVDRRLCFLGVDGIWRVVRTYLMAEECVVKPADIDPTEWRVKTFFRVDIDPIE